MRSVLLEGRLAKPDLKISLVVLGDVASLDQDAKEELLSWRRSGLIDAIQSSAVSHSCVPLAEVGGSEGEGNRSWALAGDELTSAVPGNEWGTGNGVLVRTPEWLRLVLSDVREDQLVVPRLAQANSGICIITAPPPIPEHLFFGALRRKLHEVFPAIDDVQGMTLTSVKYSDRYFRSPESAAVLATLICGFVPDGADVAMVILVAAMSAEPKGYYTDWQDDDARRRELQRLFKQCRPLIQLDVQAKRKEQIPHSRTLRLSYLDGRHLNLKFDQGVDYWKLDGDKIVPKYSRTATDITTWFD